jgi:hypothetical protein
MMYFLCLKIGNYKWFLLCVGAKDVISNIEAFSF